MSVLEAAKGATPDPPLFEVLTEDCTRRKAPLTGAAVVVNGMVRVRGAHA